MKGIVILFLFIFMFLVVVVTFSIVQLYDYMLIDREITQLNYGSYDKVIINNNVINVEIADENMERVLGLMYRENLDENNGMLFVFENDRIRSFWMKNTLIALDMIFIDSNKTIIDIKENAKPCKTENCSSYISKSPAKFVLEVNSGYSKENNINIGDKVQFS